MIRIDWNFIDDLKAADLLGVKVSILQKALKDIECDQNTKKALAFFKSSMGLAPKSVGLCICSDVGMRRFQKQYRKLNRTTDVLSFPAIELPNMQHSKNTHLGDIMISLPAIARGAKRGGRKFEKEFLEVFIHGCLHLLGFDHVKSRSQALEMRRVQRTLYQKARKLIRT